MEEDFMSAMIMDIGSFDSKVGTTGEDIPTSIFPTLLGKAKNSFKDMDKDFYIGQEAWEKRSVLDLSKPVQRGLIKDWDGLEKIMNFAYLEKIKIDSTLHPILIGISINTEPVSKERLMLTSFESFGVEGFYCCPKPVLTLYGSGRTSGIVIDSGDEQSSISSVKNGDVQKEASMAVELGGFDISSYLQRILKTKHFTVSNDQARQIKEKCAFIAADFSEESNNYRRGTSASPAYTYELPDGTRMFLEEERIKCTECIFNPNMINRYDPGLNEALSFCLENLEEDIIQM